MKFLCDNCKAKYQIGDEKVAGKTVRMKCRRCGYLIQVSASVTETSVARPLAMVAAPPSRPAPVMPSDEDDEKTTIMASPPRVEHQAQQPGKEAPAPSSTRPPLAGVGAPGLRSGTGTRPAAP